MTLPPVTSSGLSGAIGGLATTIRAVQLGAVALTLVACSLDRVGVGAGLDAGIVDGGPGAELDGGGVDAGDAGPIDSGVADAGVDAGQDARVDGGRDAGTDAGQDGGPPGPRPCATTYAGVPGLELCAERATECELYTDGSEDASCDEVCTAAGGVCISARSEGGSTPCGPGGPQDCDQQSNDQVCVCSRP